MAKDTLTRIAADPERLIVTAPKQHAAGLGGIAVSLQHAARYMRPGAAIKASFAMNQKGGFDCPGCAWPDPDGHRSGLGEYCENGIKALAEEAQSQLIGEEFFAQHSVAELRTWSPMQLGKAGRLQRPMILRPGATHYAPLAWPVAMDHVAHALQALPSPDQAVFYTSGRTSNEAAFLYQLFVREFGTNNLPDCSNMCHESTGVALSKVLGIGKGTVTLDDLHQAELIVVVGQNPGTNHPRMLTALEHCKDNGGKIISINPLPEAGLVAFVNPQRPLKMLTGGTRIADLHLPVTVNGDVALLKALMLRLLELDEQGGNAVDWDFIRQYTTGVEAFIEHLKSHDRAALVDASAVSAELIDRAAAMLAGAQRIVVCWAMGITQHENGTEKRPRIG